MAEQRSSAEYHKADPGWRRRTQIVLAATVVLGAIGLAYLLVWFDRMGARMSQGDLAGFERSLHQVLGALCVLLGLVGAAFAIWLFRLAAATRAERRWPPSHMRTFADVRIRYLTSADSLVAQMKGGAIALSLVVLCLLACGGWLLASA